MRTVNARRVAVAVSIAGLLALPGCISVLPEAEPTTIYRLQSGLADAAPAELRENAAVVIVERPIAPRALAGDRLALRMADGRLAYMDGANWISPAPVMLHDLLFDALQAGEPSLVPARADDGAAGDYRLRVEMRRFEAAYAGGDNAAPQAEVVLTARLIDTDARRILAAHTVRESRMAATNRQGDIVAAFSEASTGAARALAAWSASIVEDRADED